MTKTTTVTTVDDDVVPAPAAGNPSVQLHHDHEHHHHHSQYERTVGDDGTVHEKTVTEEVIREDPVKAIATAQASAQAQATVQPPAGGKKKNKKKGKVIEETTTTIIEEVTAPATTVKAASIRAPSIVLDPAPTVLAPAPTVAVPVSIAPPGSPTPSHRSVKSHKSHRSHHHPEIIVNVNVPTTNPPAPAAAAPPVIVAPIPRSPSVHAHHFPLPASNFPSPTASVRSMRLPKLHKSTAPTMAYVEAIPEGDEVEVGLGDEVVTKVITTTTTTGRPTSPPEATQPRQLVTPPPEPVVYGNYVQNDPHYRPPPKTAPAPPTMPLTPVTPPPPAGRGGSPDSFIETTTVETVTYPISVVTGATTFGGATMKGGTGARAGLSTVSATPAGTKGGLVPIPYIDYAALIRADSDVLRKATGNHHPKPSRHNSHHVHHTPAPPAPQTIATMSANLERDSKGNERLHATLRDHTGLHHIEEVLPNDSITTVAPNPTVVVDEEDEKKRRKEEKRRKKEEEKRAREPAYRPIEGDGGGLPPPKSERYAYPPAPTEIEQSARQRFLDCMGFGGGTPQGPMGAGPSMGGMVNRGWNGGPPFTPPGPATFPRPPPMMGSRPPMFGPPMMNPMMGMGMGGLGMGMGGMGMGGTCMGGMGLMGPPVPSMGMPYNPVPGMGMPMGGMGYGGMGGMGYGGRF